MASYNKVLLMGNLGQDPELKHIQSGTSVCSVSIAVNRPFKDQSGNATCDFITVVFWGSQADLVCKYLKKGSSVFVTGRLQVRIWNDNQGNKRYATEVVAEEITFLGSGNAKGESVPFLEADSRPRSDKIGSQYPVPSFNSAEQVRFEEIPDDGSLPF